MGWRKVLESAMEWELPKQAREEIASEMHAGLLAMSAPDRIAMARELLAGTDAVVVKTGPAPVTTTNELDVIPAESWTFSLSADAIKRMYREGKP